MIFFSSYCGATRRMAEGSGKKRESWAVSRRAESGADVSVNPMFSILLKLLKGPIYTQRFFSNSFGNLPSQPEPYLYRLSACLPPLGTRPGTLPPPGSPAGPAALPHGWLQDTPCWGPTASTSIFSTGISEQLVICANAAWF